MIKGKNISIIAVIIIILVSFTGCGKRLDGNEIVRYMEKKYDEKFKYVDVTGGQLGGKSLTLRLEPEKYPGEIILASCELKKDGDKTWKKFNDNYMDLVYEEQTREALEKITKEVYGECKVFFTRNKFSLLSVEIGPKTTFSEYTAYGNSISYSILLDNSHDLNKKDELSSKLIKLLKQNDIICVADIFYLKDDKLYKEIKDRSEFPLLSKNYYDEGSVIMNKDNDDVFQWRD
jgi:hypothetical protein